MSLWMQNARMSLAAKPTLILHGNVRDRYYELERGVYENLTQVLFRMARESRNPVFEEIILYDLVGGERRYPINERNPANPTEPSHGSQCLNRWMTDRILTDQKHNRFVVINYLDKLVSYKESYSVPEEIKCLLLLEKIIENITSNHRLILVSLTDTMIPVELYTQSPKCRVLPIPQPDKACRSLYVRHVLGEHEHRELISNLTDGLYLRELDHILADVKEQKTSGAREIRRIINRYRIGLEEDYWGSLDIKRLYNAKVEFTQTEGIKGQDEAVEKVVQKLILARAGLSGMASGTTAKPKGVLFFAGPTGVGKTFLAKKLAKFLFGDEEAFVRFDMSEFKEEHTVSKLIGSPPGYVGYERGGMLTNAVRERPFSVVLFDEIEKAHPKIMDIYLQLLDEGRLTDSRGQTIFFTETVIVFTSNLGCRSSDSKGKVIEERELLEKIRSDPNLDGPAKRISLHGHFRRSVEQFFTMEISRPELLNRIGSNVIPFNYIDNDEVKREIVRAHLKRISDEFADKFRHFGHELAVDVGVVDYLVAAHGRQMEENGGRGITNALEDEVLVLVAPLVLAAEFEDSRNQTFQILLEEQLRSLRCLVVSSEQPEDHNQHGKD